MSEDPRFEMAKLDKILRSSDADLPIYKDPCKCGCGKACHWDDLTTKDPGSNGEECQRCGKCDGYVPR